MLNDAPNSAPLDIGPLLAAIYDRYGFDFRDYAEASLRRRVRRRMEAEQVGTVEALREALLADTAVMERLLLDFSINYSAFFRDPGFFLNIRQRVVPWLQTHPFSRWWIAGCSAGEEVYSVAILLREAGLEDRSRIYATDFNETILAQARNGIFPLDRMKAHTRNYQQAGGTGAFSDYYSAAHGSARFDPTLVRNVVFAQHNLATDASFNEFHAILCRNVMIYFNRRLQERAMELFHGSLVAHGILGLGEKETIKFGAHADHFEPIYGQHNLLRRKA